MPTMPPISDVLEPVYDMTGEKKDTSRKVRALAGRAQPPPFGIKQAHRSDRHFCYPARA